MSSTALNLSMCLVRLWTTIYTLGAPEAERERRRQEIDSDLWEFALDSDRGGDMASSFRVLARLVLGVPDDVVWRIDQRTIRPIALRAALAVATLTVVAIVMVGQVLQPPALPSVNPAPPPEILKIHLRMPPVPPPPPPLRRQDIPDADWRALLVPPKTRDLAR